MSFSIDFRSTMQNNELLIRIPIDEEARREMPSFCEQMLVHNHIRGLLTFETEYDGEARQYCYQPGSRQSLADRLEQNKLRYGQLKAFLQELVGIVEEGMNYLIDENDYVLRPDCIFFGKEAETLYLCYCPMYQRELREQLSELFEYLMSHIDYKDSTAVIMVYELYMLSKGRNCSFSEIRAVLSRREEEVNTEIADADELHEDMGGFSGERPARRRSDYEGSFFVSERTEDETAKPEASTGYCLRADREENSILITRFPFFIEEKENEKRTERKTPSSPGQLQAKLSAREEAVYIEDMKSTNGTFVNGRRIAGNEIRKLVPGDRVMLADQSYRFLKIN